jgi:uncharacterized alkaline shock family protein YloU
MDSLSTEHVATELGTIQIAPEVLEIIAGLSTIEIEGVAGMSGGLAGGIAELLGRKNLTKGVKVQVNHVGAVIDLSVILEYGYRIPDISGQIQQNVKHTVQTMTGIHVTEVNLHIHDVRFKSQDSLAIEDTAIGRVK